MASLPSRREFIQSLAELVTDVTDTDPDCAICRDPFDPEHPPVKLGGCGHVFGLPCIIQWVQTSAHNNTCPVCRGTMFRGPPTGEGRDDEADAQELREILSQFDTELLRQVIVQILRERSAHDHGPQPSLIGSEEVVIQEDVDVFGEDRSDEPEEDERPVRGCRCMTDPDYGLEGETDDEHHHHYGSDGEESDEEMPDVEGGADEEGTPSNPIIIS